MTRKHAILEREEKNNEKKKKQKEKIKEKAEKETRLGLYWRFPIFLQLMLKTDGDKGRAEHRLDCFHEMFSLMLKQQNGVFIHISPN